LEKDKKTDFFERAIRETVSLGGDTDTNACIVGGLIGSIIGVKSIQRYHLAKVLNYDSSKTT